MQLFPLVLVATVLVGSHAIPSCNDVSMKTAIRRFYRCLRQGVPQNLGAACKSMDKTPTKRAIKSCSPVINELTVCKWKGCDPEAVIAGGWSEFGTFTDCSLPSGTTCGIGVMKHERTCTEPPPRNGGADCVGDAFEGELCKMELCTVPMDGGWSDFGAFSACSAECGGGRQSRLRSCNNPAPANGGEDCVGEAEEAQDCISQACKADTSLWTASMDTTYAAANGPLKAIDGNPDTVAHGVCGNGERWLEIDMKAPHKVGIVRVFNAKSNSYRFRMDNTEVTADGVSCGSMEVDNRAVQSYEMDCGGVVASKIRLSKIGEAGVDKYHMGCIHVSEVEVDATPFVWTASMDTTYAAANGPLKAIDGNPDTVAHDVCGNGERWLEIDMKAPRKVGIVRVFNAKNNDNPHRFRMDNTEVTADGVSCGSMEVDNREVQWYEMDCGGVVASKIRLSKIGEAGADAYHMGCIHVREVEVDATPLTVTETSL